MTDTDAKHKGSLTDYQTSWPLVQESCNDLDVSFQQAQAKLIAQGLYVGPTDRLPFAVVRAALEAEGYEQEHLRRY